MSDYIAPLPPHGADPIHDFLPPPHSSVLSENALAAISPPLHTTLLDLDVFPTGEHQTPYPTLLKSAEPEGDRPTPQVSILPPTGNATSPPHISVLPPDILTSLPTPKRPNLVRPMPKPKAQE